MAIARGTTLGRYEIESVLGAGGMGEVYRATDTRLARSVALKVLPSAASEDPDRFRRFETEARSAAALNHSGIVAVYDIGEASGTAYIVSELLEGGTLAEYASSGPLPPANVLAIAIAVGDALAAAHRKGIIHRDLKPSNILMTSEGAPKIADFGLAKLLQTDSQPADSRQPTTPDDRTREGTILGTVAYMSPEQSRGAGLDFRSDQFSFGTILYELVTGRAPFRRASVAETFSAVLREEPGFAEKEWKAYSEGFQRLVRRCLAKNANDRYESTGELVRTLRAVATAPARGISRTPWIAAVAIVLIAAVSWLVFSRRQRAPETTVSEKTLAILPFRGFAAGEDVPLRLGLADALISKLSGIRGLVVRPTSAVRRYADGADAAKVGKDLTVETVLEGSVQSVGDRLRIAAQLTRAGDGRTIWGKTFDDERRNIFSVQDRMAAEVLRALGVTPSRDEARQVSLDYTANVAAYDLYQQARAAYLANTKPDNTRAIQLFEKSLETDANYAPAHAGLAFACARYSFQYFDSNPSWAAKAEEEASIALEKGPYLAEAHQARAQVLSSLHQNFDFRRALPEVRRALELSPNLDLSHYWLGVAYCGHLGLFEEGIAALKKAAALNPGWSAPIVTQCWLRLMQGKYDEADKLCRQGVAMTPKYSIAHSQLAEILLRQGKMADAEAECDLALAAEPKNTWVISVRGALAAAQGRREEASRLIHEAIQGYDDHHVQYYAACASALLGDEPQAVAALRKVLDGNFNPYPWLQKDPLLDKLRSNSEFAGLVDQSRRRYEEDRSAYLAR